MRIYALSQSLVLLWYQLCVSAKTAGRWAWERCHRGAGSVAEPLAPNFADYFFPPFHSVSSYTLLSSNMPDPVAFLFLTVSENSVIFQNHVWEKGNKQAY